MKKTSVYLTDEEIQGLRRLSAETGRSQAAILRDAVTDYVASHPPGERRFEMAGIVDSGRRGSFAEEDEEKILFEDADRDTGWR